jgi:Sulfatase
MDYMPHTKARIFGQGVSFPNTYITTPLCCPSRSSILTGMYAHKQESLLGSRKMFTKAAEAAAPATYQ